MRRFLPFELEHWLAEWENRAEYVIGTSGIASASLPDLGLQHVSGPEVLGYGEIPGEPVLREAVARARDADPENVLLTIGGSEADFLVYFALCEPGSRVLVESPTYFPLAGIPHALGVRVERLHRRYENGFRLDVDDAIARLGPDVRVVALTNPNNPTGQVVPPGDLKRLADACAEHGAYLLVDEIFRHLSFGPMPSARGLGDHVVVTESLTKCQGLSGLRAGWILAHPDVIAACREPKALTSITNPRLDQHLAARALELEDKLLARARRIADENLGRLEKFIEASDRFEWVRPKAAPISAPRLLGDPDDVRFCRALLDAESTLVAPGTYLDLPGHVRLGFGAEPDHFREGLARLERFCERA